MASSIRLYSVYHKPFPLYPNAAYVTPIQVGKAVAPGKMEMLGDDTGDHISHLNDLYCELTAAYWIRKNAPRDTDYWGLCHYRRYLIPTRYKWTLKKRSRYPFKTSQQQLDRLLTPALYQTYQSLLVNNDIIVQRPWQRKEKGIVYTTQDFYTKAHIKEDYDMAMQVVREKYPAFEKSIETFNNGTTLFYNNVMIATWAFWDAYLDWLFDILFEVQHRIEILKKGYPSRVMGFLAERLHNLYVMHQGIKPAYLTLGLFENPI